MKSVGVVGTVFAVQDGLDTYNANRKKYGNVHAAVDGVAHTAGTFTGAAVGAVIGSAIPIPIVGTVIGTVAGDLVGKGINYVWDKFSHGEWKLSKLKMPKLSMPKLW